MNTEITTKYFKEYREKLGFTNQGNAKKFFGAKDVFPLVDFAYIDLLNERLKEIVLKINGIVDDNAKIFNLEEFNSEIIDHAYILMKDNDILPKLNNQGRRPEQVYFSWMRGHIISNFFLKALSVIFETDISSITLVGDDDLTRIETFKRTPKADLEITMSNNQNVRLEIQAGFTGINDIKQHKVLEAKRLLREEGKHTVDVHFDIYNGQVAFIKLDEIEDDSVNWITRQQMEGQTVFNIDQNYFVWKLTETPILFKDIEF